MRLFPDIGGRERGRVVDAVAHFRDDLPPGLQLLDDPELVLGQEVSANLKAEGPADKRPWFVTQGIP